MFRKAIINKLRRQTVLIMADAIIISLALLLCLYIRYDGNIPGTYLTFSYLIPAASLFVIPFITSFVVFGLYNSLWSYASIDELISVVYGVTFGTLLSALTVYLIGLFMPWSIFPMMWFVNIIFIGGMRLGFRILRRVYRSRLTPGLKRVLIIGAGSAGSMVLKELRDNQQKINSQAVGFIDDDPEKQSMKIHGIPVLGDHYCLKKILIDYAIDEVIIAMPTASKKVVREIVDCCKKAQVTVKTLPGVYDILNGNIQMKKLREVDIEDILGRDPVCVDMEEICGYLQGQTILVTGAGGSIGSELCRQIAHCCPKELILLGRGENSIFDINMELSSESYDFKITPVICDVRDLEAMDKLFKKCKPNVVFHAAAHKHVPLMEQNCEEAVKNNVFGTRNVVQLSDQYGVNKFVLISTDKAVNPTSIMGITKRIGEMIMQSAAKTSSTKFCAVRFGNVLGSRGSVVPIFKKQIAAGGPITVTHPQMTRYFMTIKEAVQLVIQAGAMCKQGKIFVLDMGEPVKILDMAEDLIKLSGLEPYSDIQIQFSGVRPGEKLHEELFTNKESFLTTKHERIHITEPDEVSTQKFRKDIFDRINGLMDGQGSVQKKLKNIVNN